MVPVPVPTFEVTVPVLATYLNHKKQIFQQKIRNFFGGFLQLSASWEISATVNLTKF
jgi:hypothetical protein